MIYDQQGDVMLKKISKLPKGLTKVATKVLQHGEVTGHKHQFAYSDDVTVYVDKAAVSEENTITPNEQKYVVVGNTAYLRHEEHKPPTVVEPGIYELDIVREFDYEKHEMSRVVD